jgi:hypothetical protein
MLFLGTFGVNKRLQDEFWLKDAGSDDVIAICDGLHSRGASMHEKLVSKP